MDTMGLRDALNIALTGLAFFGGWVLRDLHVRIASLEKGDKEMAAQLAELRIELPTHYVRNSDHKSSLDNIFDALRRIEDKVDNKADKEIYHPTVR